jgi:hypothetical protein
MKKRIMMVLAVLAVPFVFVTSGSAAVPYHFNGTALYQFGGPPTADFHFGPAGDPDTSFVVITNNGSSTFTGNIGFNAISPCFGDFSASYAVTLAPGKSASVSINNEASNFCGYNGPFDAAPTAQQGAEFFMDGTVTLGPDTEPLVRKILDRDIHSHVFATNPFGVTLDNYILQGGDPFGRDTGDDFEVGQAPATFQFVSVTDFRGVRRKPDINVGHDHCGTGHQSINFTGIAGSASDTWITVYDPAGNPVFSSVSLSADVIFQKFNNLKGAGLLALFNEAPGEKGLALIVNDAGNTDSLQLATVDQAGQRVVLASVPLKAGIKECVWYHLTMDVLVNGANVSVTGNVYEHVTKSDPGSSLGSQVGSTLSFAGPRPTGVESKGEVGVVATATSAVVNASVTNFEIDD